MTLNEFQRLAYDESELTEAEMMAAAALGLADPEEWGAPGMGYYDCDGTAPAS